MDSMQNDTRNQVYTMMKKGIKNKRLHRFVSSVITNRRNQCFIKKWGKKKTRFLEFGEKFFCNFAYTWGSVQSHVFHRTFFRDISEVVS